MIVWIGKRSDAFRVHKTIDEISKEERPSGRSSLTVDKGPNRQNKVRPSPFVILRNAVTKNLFAIDRARILRFRSG